MRYQFIQEHRMTVLLRMLGVSASAIYQWQKRLVSQRARHKQLLVAQICELFEQSKGRYGSPRIYRDLQALGIRCSHKRVARLMKEQNLVVRRTRRFVATTDAGHAFPVAQNLLNREFRSRPWRDSIERGPETSPIVPTAQGWLYVAVVLDLKSRKVIGWSMKDSLEQTLVHEALKMALGQRFSAEVPELLLFHSDRGSQYATNVYQERLKERGIVCSMSRRGNCWDNAPLESFFATLKKEEVHRERY